MEIPELITVKEAADKGLCSEGKIRALCASGVIPSTRLFGDLRIVKSGFVKTVLESINRPKLGQLRRNAA